MVTRRGSEAEGIRTAGNCVETVASDSFHPEPEVNACHYADLWGFHLGLNCVVSETCRLEDGPVHPECDSQREH